MTPIPGAKWAMRDREWGLAIDGARLVVLERRFGPDWLEIDSMALPDLIATIEAWIRDVLVPRLQALRDAIWPQAPAEAAPTATVASVLSERLGRGAVQYNYTTGRFGYVPHDSGNV